MDTSDFFFKTGENAHLFPKKKCKMNNILHIFLDYLAKYPPSTGKIAPPI